MDHIRLFYTVDEFVSAYTGDEYIEPWVSYCPGNSGITKFNKTMRERYLTFNIISGGDNTLEYLKRIT